MDALFFPATSSLHASRDFRNLTMDINVKGVWYGCKHAIIAMRKSGGGSVINTASFVAIMGAATPQLACKYSWLPNILYTNELNCLLPCRHCLQGRRIGHDVNILRSCSGNDAKILFISVDANLPWSTHVKTFVSTRCALAPCEHHCSWTF